MFYAVALLAHTAAQFSKKRQEFTFWLILYVKP